MNSAFFTQFLMISQYQTLIFIVALIALFVVMNQLQKKKISFSKRMLISTGLGLLLGIGIQAMSGFSDAPMEVTFVAETTKWYSLFGDGFMDLIRMLVIPLIVVSIIHVIINMKEGIQLGKLVRTTLIVTTIMVAISVVLGLVVGVAFGLGGGAVAEGTAKMRSVTNVVDMLLDLLPANPIEAMAETNIIALVIFSAFFGLGAKRMSKKYMDVVKPFFDLINALHKIIMSIAMTVIRWMPYAVIALLAKTIAQRGLASILEVGMFIIALYIAAAIMFGIQLVVLAIMGINPKAYVKKGLSVIILAFTSRSSVGCLPMTVETLTKQMGVNDGTASFVAGFGTTAGMQGCAGIFPAMLLVYIANLNGIALDLNFIMMSIIVVTLGSFGIAGIPGTSTMAASVALSGTGLGHLFPMVSPIIAVDPLIDMARTALNVSGAMVNAIIVDKTMGQINMETYNNMDLKKVVEEVA